MSLSVYFEGKVSRCNGAAMPFLVESSVFRAGEAVLEWVRMKTITGRVMDFLGQKGSARDGLRWGEEFDSWKVGVVTIRIRSGESHA